MALCIYSTPESGSDFVIRWSLALGLLGRRNKIATS